MSGVSDREVISDLMVGQTALLAVILKLLIMKDCLAFEEVREDVENFLIKARGLGVSETVEGPAMHLLAIMNTWTSPK